MNKKRNSYRQGTFTFLGYKTKDATYISACEELCILSEDTTSERAKHRTLSAAQLYLESIIEDKLPVSLLNQGLPDEVKEEFFEAVKNEEEYFEKKSLTIKHVLESDVENKKTCVS